MLRTQQHNAGTQAASKVNAGVAQLVEQRIRNAKVGGSIPLSGTKYSKTYERFLK